MSYWVLDDQNNKVEAYDKEGILAFLRQAIEEGTLAGIASDSAFVDKLKCCVTGGTNKIAFVTQAQYNHLSDGGELINNCYYFIIDDSSCADIEAALQIINQALDSLDTRLNRVTTELNSLGEKAPAARITQAGLYAVMPSSTPEYTYLINIWTLESGIPDSYRSAEINGQCAYCDLTNDEGPYIKMLNTTSHAQTTPLKVYLIAKY